MLTQAKRQREQAKRDKRRAKDERRAARKAAKDGASSSAVETDVSARKLVPVGPE